MKIEIKVKGLIECQKALNNLGDRIENPDINLMRRLADTTVDDIDTRFMTRGYGTWAPLAESTIQHKKGNQMVLIDTGAMMGSVTIKSIQPGSLVVTVPYGGGKHNPDVPTYHQKGTKKMPQRRIIEVTSKLKNALTSTVMIWISDMIKAFRTTV